MPHADADSPPPQDLGTPLSAGTSSAAATPSLSYPTATTAASRKRKRAPATASSPAPPDQAANGTTDLLATSRADLSSRPILTISRGPVFIPDPGAPGGEWYKTEMVGVNRVGYRYVPAGINPAGFVTACRTIESNPTSFRISWEDRSPYLRVSKDGLSIAGSKGFRSARCNAPMREGKWYMEVKILHGGGEHVAGGEETRREGSHVRIGWGRREAPLNAPVGLDGYSYGYRDKTGDKVTLSRPRPYGKSFGSGDVVGMYISLPPHREANMKDPHDPAHLKRERIPIDLKGQEVFEILEYPQSKEMAALMDYSGKSTNSAPLPSSSTKQKTAANGKPERGGPGPGPGSTQPGSGTKTTTQNLRPLPTLPGSRIAFFVNGQSQGVAFQDLYDYLPLHQSDTQRKANSKKRTREGVKEHRENPFDDGMLGYFPFISLFNDASVRLNPGPDFDFPPPDDIDAVLDGASVNPTPAQPSLDAPIPPVPAPPPPTPATTTDTDIIMSDTKPPLAPTLTATPANPSRTWRPVHERYPEFMEEEWAFDAREEAEAIADLAKAVAAEEAEEERKRQREKRRKHTEARKKAKAAAAANQKKGITEDAVVVEDENLSHSPSPLGMVGLGLQGAGLPAHLHASTHHSHNHNHNHHQHQNHQPSPSPLRHSTSAYDHERERERERDLQHHNENQTEDGHSHQRGRTEGRGRHPHPHDRHNQDTELELELEHELFPEHEHEPSSSAHSPAPTFASYAEGAQSGYTSENPEHMLPEDDADNVHNDNDMDVDQDIEATLV